MTLRSCSTTCTSQSIKSDLVGELGRWLGQFHWDWMSTLTFGRPTSEAGAQTTTRKYFQNLETASGVPTYAVWTLERAELGMWHVHALIGDVGSLQHRCTASRSCRSRCGTHLWHAGFADVHPFRYELGGEFYTVKGYRQDSCSLEIHNVPIRREEMERRTTA